MWQCNINRTLKSGGFSVSVQTALQQLSFSGLFQREDFQTNPSFVPLIRPSSHPLIPHRSERKWACTLWNIWFITVPGPGLDLHPNSGLLFQYVRVHRSQTGAAECLQVWCVGPILSGCSGGRDLFLFRCYRTFMVTRYKNALQFNLFVCS